ncbi:fumarate reductase/succinate dehydrogenase flavoprotein subunit, partial [bacterium]
LDAVSTDAPEFKEAEAAVTERVSKLLKVNGKTTTLEFHRELGKLMWDYCGMSRSETGLKKLLAEIPALRERFWKDVKVLGGNEEFNQSLERAGRVADYMEFAEMMALDALERKESCGGHFREESQTPDNEAKRDDEKFAHVAAWEFKGDGKAPVRHVEPLTFEHVKLTQRSYK